MLTPRDADSAGSARSRFSKLDAITLFVGQLQYDDGAIRDLQELSCRDGTRFCTKIGVSGVDDANPPPPKALLGRVNAMAS